MQQTHPIPEKAGVTFQPPCPTCGQPMWLIRLSPVGYGEDLREFECKVCDHKESLVVKYR